MKWPIMWSTPAWCNPNQILPHYPQNGEAIQQPLLPVMQNPNTVPHSTPKEDLECSQLILAIGFVLEKKNVPQTEHLWANISWFPMVTIMSFWSKHHFRISLPSFLVRTSHYRQLPICDFSTLWCCESHMHLVETLISEFWSFPGLAIGGMVLSRDTGQRAMAPCQSYDVWAHWVLWVSSMCRFGGLNALLTYDIFNLQQIYLCRAPL
jgi:hypothetical protein